MIEIGDKAPEILGEDENSNLIKISNYKGRKVALYFYPKDSTPGCTAQANNIRDNYEKLLEAGYQVIGASVDSKESHIKFKDKHNLPFPLISDTDKKLVNEFGVWAEKKLFGKTYMGTLRTTFIIDEKGVIENIITSKQVKTRTHGIQILDL